MKSENVVSKPRTFVFDIDQTDFDLHKTFIKNTEGSVTICLPEVCYSETVRPEGGDSVRLRYNSEFIEGRVPDKPQDCILIKDFKFISDETDGTIE